MVRYACGVLVADGGVQDGPQEFTLVDPDDEDKRSTVRIEARYLPVPIKLEARESVNSRSIHIEHAGLLLTRLYRPGSLARRPHRWPQYPWHRQRRYDGYSQERCCDADARDNREIRSVRCLPPQRPAGVQVADQEEDAHSRVERELRRPSGMQTYVTPQAKPLC